MASSSSRSHAFRRWMGSRSSWDEVMPQDLPDPLGVCGPDVYLALAWGAAVRDGRGETLALVSGKGGGGLAPSAETTLQTLMHLVQSLDHSGQLVLEARILVLGHIYSVVAWIADLVDDLLARDHHPDSSLARASSAALHAKAVANAIDAFVVHLSAHHHEPFTLAADQLYALARDCALITAPLPQHTPPHDLDNA